MKNRRWRWLVLLPLLLLLAAGGYLTWATVQNAPTAAAEAALAGDGDVAVATDPWMVFRPAGEMPETGLIFYPGGLVPPAAYAPAARALAAAGYLAVVVPMPLNLAVTAPERAAAVMGAYPTVTRWAVGGHSLGGAMAARFADENPEQVAGLVLWASYPAESNDLSGRDLAVASIYGSEDGLATPADIAASAALLPADSTFVEIEGGNHTQFGYYGEGLQRGDRPATISRAAQQEQVVAATRALLESLAQPDSAGASSP